MKYRLVYISTRNFDGSLIPVDLFEPVPLNHITDDYNEADRMRCELCSIMNFAIFSEKTGGTAFPT